MWYLNGSAKMTAKKYVDLFESYLRFNKGKKVREDTWDFVTVPTNALQIKEKYRIDFKNEIIPTDQDMIDRLFMAGVDMLVSTGFYNVDTGRTLMITEDEIYEGLKRAPTSLKLGEGKDQVVCKARHGNDRMKPIIEGGPTGAPVSENVFTPMIQAYAQEPVIDTLVSGVLSTLNGIPSTTNTPFEIYATIAEIRLVREALARAGRSGMCI